MAGLLVRFFFFFFFFFPDGLIEGEAALTVVRLVLEALAVDLRGGDDLAGVAKVEALEVGGAARLDQHLQRGGGLGGAAAVRISWRCSIFSAA